MNLKFLASRRRNIIINPVKAWDTIYSENKSLGYVTANFFIPLVLLVAVSAFFGAKLFTHSGFSGAYAVLAGIKYFIVMTLAIYATAYFLSEITKSSETPADFTVSFKIVLCSVVPLLLCQMLSNLFESLNLRECARSLWPVYFLDRCGKDAGSSATKKDHVHVIDLCRFHYFLRCGKPSADNSV